MDAIIKLYGTRTTPSGVFLPLLAEKSIHTPVNTRDHLYKLIRNYMLRYYIKTCQTSDTLQRPHPPIEI